MTDANHDIIEHSGEGTPTLTPARRRQQVLLHRIIFFLGVAAVVAVLSIPLLVMLVAIRGELRVPLPGDLPNHEVRVWTMMEIDTRGFGFSSTQVTRGEEQVCLQTNVRFLLWEGEAEPVAYCECYVQDAATEQYLATSVNEGACGS